MMQIRPAGEEVIEVVSGGSGAPNPKVQEELRTLSQFLDLKAAASEGSGGSEPPVRREKLVSR